MLESAILPRVAIVFLVAIVFMLYTVRLLYQECLMLSSKGLLGDGLFYGRIPQCASLEAELRRIYEIEDYLVTQND